jgi:segregation and condensation protein A
MLSVGYAAGLPPCIRGFMQGWDTLQHFLPEGKAQQSPLEMRAALVSTFAATLELTRQGGLELQQEGPFGPIKLRRRNIS